MEPQAAEAADAAVIEEEVEPATPEADDSLLGSVFPVQQLRSGAALASSLLWSSWGAVVDASKDGLSALRQSELMEKVVETASTSLDKVKVAAHRTATVVSEQATAGLQAVRHSAGEVVRGVTDGTGAVWEAVTDTVDATTATVKEQLQRCVPDADVAEEER